MKYDVTVMLLLVASLFVFIASIWTMNITYTMIGCVLFLTARGVERYERHLMQKRLNEDKI